MECILVEGESPRCKEESALGSTFFPQNFRRWLCLALFLAAWSAFTGWQFTPQNASDAWLAPARDLLSRTLGPNRSHIEIVHENPLRLIATVDAPVSEAASVDNALRHLLAINPAAGESLLVVRGPVPVWRPGPAAQLATALFSIVCLLSYWGMRPKPLPGIVCRRSFWSRFLPRRLRAVRGIVDGRREAAVYMMNLEPTVRDEVFSKLHPSSVDALRTAMDNLGPVLPAEIAKVRKTFHDLMAKSCKQSCGDTCQPAKVAAVLLRFYLSSVINAVPAAKAPPAISSWKRRHGWKIALMLLISAAGTFVQPARVSDSLAANLRSDLAQFLGPDHMVVEIGHRGPFLPTVMAWVGRPTAPDLSELALLQSRVRDRGLDLKTYMFGPSHGRLFPPVSWSGLGMLLLACYSLSLTRQRPAPAVIAAPVAVGGARPRRRLHQCEQCDEIFVDTASFESHRLAHSKPQPLKPYVPTPTKPVTHIMQVQALSVEVGRGLLSLVDPNQGAMLLERVLAIRRHMALELGIVTPGVQFRDNLQLKPNEYRILIREEEVARGEVVVNHLMVTGLPEKLAHFGGSLTADPTFGMPATWIPKNRKAEAEARQIPVFDVVSVIATHLTQTIRERAAELLGRQETKAILDLVAKTHPALLAEVYPEPLGLGAIHNVLRSLLAERVSIRDTVLILETLADHLEVTDDVGMLVEFVRMGLAQRICRDYTDASGRLHAAIMPEGLDDVFVFAEAACARLREEGHPPVLLVSNPLERAEVRRMLSRSFPEVAVLSMNEIAPKVRLVEM